MQLHYVSCWSVYILQKMLHGPFNVKYCICYAISCHVVLDEGDDNDNSFLYYSCTGTTTTIRPITETAQETWKLHKYLTANKNT